MSPSIKLIILALAACVLFRCDNDVNPYLARTDSGTKIVTRSFTNGDTLSIFSTESLSVALHLKEYIDRCVFRTRANRFWSGMDTVIPASSFDQGPPLTLRFSFYDTGWQTITFTTYRTMGDSIAETLSVYTQSPLSQAEIRAHSGDTVVLRTPPVNDDIQYVWDFGNSTVVQNSVNQVRYTITTPLSPGWGELYVSDLSHRSPSVFFRVVDDGIVKPVSSIPVRFLSDAIEIPDSLTVATDTLRRDLRIDPLSGTPPIRFSARIANGPVLLENSEVGRFVWCPAAIDTGMRRLQLTVRDSLGFADTIETLVTIVPLWHTSIFFESPGSSGPESVSPWTIRVLLSGPAHRSLSVAYAVDWKNTTADSADFYLPEEKTLIFSPGDTARNIVLSIVNDTFVEPNERLTLRFSSFSADVSIGNQSTFVHTILNNDFTLRVSTSGSGTVVRTVSGVANPGPYEAGTTVTLEARPATGYSMGHWSGPVIVSADPAIVNVHMDSSVSAQVAFKIAPPVITVQPIDAKITKGQRASFRLTATGVNLTYQWKRNDNTIPEATSATYTTPVLTVSSSGVHYRCVVSNPAGSVTSRDAVVIVAK